MAANAMPVSSRQLHLDNPLRSWGGTVLLLGLIVLAEAVVVAIWLVPGLEPSETRSVGVALAVAAGLAGLGLMVVGIRACVLFVVPADAPAPIGRALDVLPELLDRHSITETYREPGFLQAILNGVRPRFTYLTRPQLLLLDGLVHRLWQLPLPALLLLLPQEPNTPWLVVAWLGIMTLALGFHLTAVLFSGADVPHCDVAERTGRTVVAGNPVDLFHHLLTVVGDLREGKFPNRTWKNRPPDVGARAVNNHCDAELLLETQPMPVATGGRLAARVLDVGGFVLGVVGWAILLLSSALPGRQESAVAAMGGLSAVLLSWRFLTHAHRLHGTFRFRSDLFCVRLRGSYGVAEVGLGNGDGGRFFSRSTRIQSDLHWTVQATRLLTECSPPEWLAGWRRRRRARRLGEVYVANNSLDRTALGAPRYLVEAREDELEFLDRLERLLKSLHDYRDSGGRLVGLDLSDEGVRQLVEANLRLTQLHHQTTLPPPSPSPPTLTAPTALTLAPAETPTTGQTVPAAVEALLRELWRECLKTDASTEARERLEGLARLYGVEQQRVAALGEEVRAERNSTLGENPSIESASDVGRSC